MSLETMTIAELVAELEWHAGEARREMQAALPRTVALHIPVRDTPSQGEDRGDNTGDQDGEPVRVL